ncbi:unnamed protein product [Amoebophrya sp. A120]|nr:unnamed protein product [Amoebophrya sp. A120]|eukprot:GSA120T00010634001.1
MPHPQYGEDGALLPAYNEFEDEMPEEKRPTPCIGCCALWVIITVSIVVLLAVGAVIACVVLGSTTQGTVVVELDEDWVAAAAQTGSEGAPEPRKSIPDPVGDEESPPSAAVQELLNAKSAHLTLAERQPPLERPRSPAGDPLYREAPMQFAWYRNTAGQVAGQASVRVDIGTGPDAFKNRAMILCTGCGAQNFFIMEESEQFRSTTEKELNPLPHVAKKLSGDKKVTVNIYNDGTSFPPGRLLADEAKVVLYQPEKSIFPYYSSFCTREEILAHYRQRRSLPDALLDRLIVCPRNDSEPPAAFDKKGLWPVPSYSLSLAPSASDRERVLNFVHIEEPTDDPSGFHGILGLGFWDERNGGANNLHARDAAAHVLQQLRLGAIEEGRENTVFSFDITVPAGHSDAFSARYAVNGSADSLSWSKKPHFILGTSPAPDRLRRFPVMPEPIRNDELLSQLLSDRGLSALGDPGTPAQQSSAHHKMALKAFARWYLYKTENEEVNGAENGSAYEYQFRGTPLREQQHLPSHEYVKEKLDFRGPSWSLAASKIRIGNTIYDAADDVFAPEAGVEFSAEKHLQADVLPSVEWEYDTTKGGINGKSEEAKTKLRPRKPSRTTYTDKRYSLHLDSAHGGIMLAAPLREVFDKKFKKLTEGNGKRCEDGPDIAFELTEEIAESADEGEGARTEVPASGSSANQKSSSHTHWYVLHAKNYCYCKGKKHVQLRHCVGTINDPSDTLNRKAMYLGRPFHRAFYVGYDFVKREILLPRF